MSELTIWETKNALVRFTLKTSFQSSNFILKDKPSRVIPALLIRMSKPPEVVKASFITLVNCSAFPQSAQISVKVVLFSFANSSNSALLAEGFEHNPYTWAPFSKKVFVDENTSALSDIINGINSLNKFINFPLLILNSSFSFLSSWIFTFLRLILYSFVSKLLIIFFLSSSLHISL